MGKSYQINDVQRITQTDFLIQPITLKKLIELCTHCEVSIPLKWASEKNFTIKVDTEYVKKIEAQFIRNEYLPTAIMMTLYGYHESLYNEGEKTLQITDHQLLHLTEGLHRICAILDIAGIEQVMTHEMVLKINISTQ